MDTSPKYVHAMDTSQRRVHKAGQIGHIMSNCPHRERPGTGQGQALPLVYYQ